MRLKKWVSMTMVCVIPALFLCACGGKKQVSNYVLPETMETVESGVVSQNRRFSLRWDDEKKCVMRSVTVQGGDVDQVPFDI